MIQVKRKKSKGGAPPKKIDEALVLELASIGCTTREIARVCKCSSDTLERRFMDSLEAGRASVQISLRRAQLKVAFDSENKSQAAMLIWLGKQFLAQKEPPREIALPPSDGSKDGAGGTQVLIAEFIGLLDARRTERAA